MKKVFVGGVLVIMMGLVIAGSGSVIGFEPDLIVEQSRDNVILFNPALNASFLAPRIINYTVNPMYTPSYYHALLKAEIIGIDDYYYFQ